MRTRREPIVCQLIGLAQDGIFPLRICVRNQGGSYEEIEILKTFFSTVSVFRLPVNHDSNAKNDTNNFSIESFLPVEGFQLTRR